MYIPNNKMNFIYILILVGVVFVLFEVLFEILFEQLIGYYKERYKLNVLRKKTRRIKISTKATGDYRKEFSKILKNEILIGRGNIAQVRINDVYMSSAHCKVILENNTVYVEDLKSTRGTYLNGKKVNEHAVLRNEDVLVVGSTEIKINIGDFY
ncbi:FHA domain-containing protein [Clostridium grantii]|uniref:FHA domain-containing protein n=1 Tax=Clostridium grantii DSM 8605 TaxID=1121316 RepID=A0A1M5UCV8_9CLOT|nr:FHA domain-containing protein [Clostridium grantii]SHH60895.1 FHA domain-containing protein [Clostridium grantii DSM 8605]